MQTKDQRRVTEVRKKLAALRGQGYRYLVTVDDGETWVGSEQPGLEIERLMHGTFLGHITVDR